MEQHLEVLKDNNCQVHPTRGLRPQNLFWASILGGLVANAYFEFELFAQLHNEAVNLQHVHSKYASVISPDKDLPEEFLTALLKFRYYLERAPTGILGQLKQSALEFYVSRACCRRSPEVAHTLCLCNIGPGMLQSGNSGLGSMEKKIVLYIS